MTSNRRRIAAQRRNKEAGSLNDGEPVFIAVAKLRRPHGLKGEMLVTLLTDFPERIKPGTVFYLGQDYAPITIKSRRGHNQGLLLSFEELPNRADLETERNKLLYAKVADLPELEEGEYYHHQLIGFHVVNEENEELGRLVEILETGANDVYVVRPENGKELLFPATSEVIQSINLEKKRIEIRLIPGLKE